jgi:hypothetical protein
MAVDQPDQETPPSAGGKTESPDTQVHAGSRANAARRIFRPMDPFFKSIATSFPKLLNSLIALACIYVVLALTVWYGKHHLHSKNVTITSYLFAFEVLFIAGIVIWFACQKADPKGLQYLYTGDDKRTSTSKVQYLIWTVGVAFALAYVSGHELVSGQSFECDTKAAAVNCIPGGSTWEQYIILLGVPAAAAVLAKGITSYKVNNGIVQKVENSGTTGFSLTDVVGNDDGTPSLVDSQYLIFNVIAFLYVAVHFVQRGTLVNVPVMLLGLTSTAASVYALNKTLQANPPQIGSVTPKVVAPGTKVTIKGANLTPSGSSESTPPGVSIGGVPAIRVEQLNTNTITAIAPDGMNDQDAYLTVTTAANITTEPYDLTILAGPTIVAWATPPVPGEQATLLVNGLPNDGDPHVLEVIANGTPAAAAQLIGKNRVTFTLDSAVTRGQVNLELLVDRIPSGTVTLTVV